MKASRKLLVILFTAAQAIVLSAQPLSDAQIIEAIRERPSLALSNSCPYISPEIRDTPAPAGYKPFYVSHVGRHGSRYDIKAAGLYQSSVSLMDTLHVHNLLTPKGDSLRTEMRHIRAAFLDGADGMLTDRGTREHMTIAANLYRRVPELFSQQDRRKVQCTATMVARTIQSMAGFTASLARLCPNLDIELCSRNGLGFNKPLYFPNPELIAMPSEQRSKLINEALEKFIPGEDKIKELKARLFKDPSKVSPKQMRSIFITCMISCCLDIDIDPLRFFTPEELFEFSKYREALSCYNYGSMDVYSEGKTIEGRRMAQLLLDDADAAIQGNGRCADLRFAHDGNIGSLMFLLKFGPYAYTATESEPYRNFLCSRNICMASNLQLIFYRKNASSEVLVKPIYNELEINIPGLKPVAGVYYKWSELRRYIAGKAFKLDPLPEYYNDYLKKKAKEITKLKKDELDGFVFITDMHFPTNHGNAAAMMERLSETVSLNRIIYGGDALTYLNDMNEGMFGQISSFEQMKGAAPLYWIRGNHDVVNYTGKKPGITAERKALDQWDLSALMAKFRGSDAVTDERNPESAYYWFDSPAARIRYIVFDTTDSVMDNRMIQGVSKPQLRFLANACMTAPEGYRIVYLSHVPIFDKYEKKTVKTMLGARNLITAMETHTVLDAEGLKFDFSKRPDLKLICGMCGHRHRDYITETTGGTLQINVEADCNYARKEAAGTLNEQSFDYVSIAKDGKTIRIVKLGDGENKTYNIK